MNDIENSTNINTGIGEKKSVIKLIAAEDMATRGRSQIEQNVKIKKEKKSDITLVGSDVVTDKRIICDNRVTDYGMKMNEEKIDQDINSNIDNSQRNDITKKKKYKKKLIEVGMPLNYIKEQSSREKSDTKNLYENIKVIHPWWSRKPLSTSKDTLFAQIVDDPSNYLPEKEAADERDKLFDIMKRLIQPKDPRMCETLAEARMYIAKSTDNNPPVLYDPFSGGASIAFAGQILGLDVICSDLNPVAVILAKSLIELPYRYRNQSPKSPINKRSSPFKNWDNAAGIADDLRYYGEWIEKQAFERIGYLYPKITYLGRYYTIVAQIYFRTVKCQNPACQSDVPLVSKFWLASKRNTWVDPIIDRSVKPNKVSFKIRTTGTPPNGTFTANAGRCICCNAPISKDYVREQGKLGKILDKAVAIVAKGDDKGKIYLPTDTVIFPEVPESDFLNDIGTSPALTPFNYGYVTVGSMFNPRQKHTLETFVNLVGDARQKCLEDSKDAEYAKTMAVYLTLTVSNLANRMSTSSLWFEGPEVITNAFTQQAPVMAWEYPELNPFSDSTGNWGDIVETIAQIIESIPAGKGKAFQLDAARRSPNLKSLLISTDPPYYDVMYYADWSDFFYGIFRVCLKTDFPDLFSTISTPKSSEIVANVHRFNGNKSAAGNNFRNRLKLAIENIVTYAHDEYPMTIYYAYKQKSFEKDSNYTAWESILGVMIDAGLQIVRTWPMHTEKPSGLKATKNVLVSSIVLVCRKRETDNATIVTRKDFVNSLIKELPAGLMILQKRSYISPIDMEQAAIGIGMSVFSKYTKVLEADGRPMNVNMALRIINKELDNYLTEQDFDMDKETRFCLTWYEQYGWNYGKFGDAHVLAIAKGTSDEDIKKSGIVDSIAGKVRLLKRSELEKDWDPTNDKKLTVWKSLHQLINILDQKGETGAVNTIRKIGNLSESIKGLSYRLFSLCNKKGWQEDAFTYNSLISSWPSIMEKIQTQRTSTEWE